MCGDAMRMRFPWPRTDPDGCQLWLSELAQAFATEELWETRGSEFEAWDIEHAADQVRMFLWNFGQAGALQAAFQAGMEAEFNWRMPVECWRPGCGYPIGGEAEHLRIKRGGK